MNHAWLGSTATGLGALDFCQATNTPWARRIPTLPFARTEAHCKDVYDVLALSTSEIASQLARVNASLAALYRTVSEAPTVRNVRPLAASTSSVNDCSRAGRELPAINLGFARGWTQQFARAQGFTQLVEDWDGEGSGPVDTKTLADAMALLTPLSGRTPAPSFSPGSEGDLWALWAGYGLDIEICFRRPGSVFAMISDQRGEVSEFEDEDPDLVATSRALVALSRRFLNAESRENLVTCRIEAPTSTSSVGVTLTAA